MTTSWHVPWLAAARHWPVALGAGEKAVDVLDHGPAGGEIIQRGVAIEELERAADSNGAGRLRPRDGLRQLSRASSPVGSPPVPVTAAERMPVAVGGPPTGSREMLASDVGLESPSASGQTAFSVSLSRKIVIEQER